MTAAALCLAMVMYAEARGEGAEGMLRVAEVVVNRVAIDRYPDDVCSVVKQPSQFAYMEGEGKPWRTAVGIAQDVIAGEDVLPDTGATHFHSGQAPYWADSMQHVATYGGHRFYRE